MEEKARPHSRQLLMNGSCRQSERIGCPLIYFWCRCRHLMNVLVVSICCVWGCRRFLVERQRRKETDYRGRCCSLTFVHAVAAWRCYFQVDCTWEGSLRSSSYKSPAADNKAKEQFNFTLTRKKNSRNLRIYTIYERFDPTIGLFKCTLLKLFFSSFPLFCLFPVLFFASYTFSTLFAL